MTKNKISFLEELKDGISIGIVTGIGAGIGFGIAILIFLLTVKIFIG